MITLTVDGDSPFDKNDQLLKTSRQQSINMVVQFNAADFQQLGLELADFDLRRQGRVNNKTNAERFRSQYYASPKTCEDIYNDLQTTVSVLIFLVRTNHLPISVTGQTFRFSGRPSGVA